ncbi:hypothetical protein [Pseudopedobacter beijingensis]|uniref:Uncharacterized protein n=1 Tax=Pseudopedobacter beijingensis TaxID=1207056 RepID=A0ABW4II32_9SPHI
MKDKKGKKPTAPYSLSPNSIKANNEFAEANRVFSLLYKRFQQVMSLHWDPKKLNRLRRLILEIIRTAPVEQTGNRKLWDGDFKKLEGFQLNTKNTATNVFRALITTSIDPNKGLSFYIPPFKYDVAFTKTHPNTTAAEVRLFMFSFDIVNKVSSGGSILLINQRHGEDLEKEYTFNLPLDNNRLTLIIRKVSFKSGSDHTDILDRQYIDATLTHAIYLKDGQLVTFVPEPKEPLVQKIETPVGVWEDLG